MKTQRPLRTQDPVVDGVGDFLVLADDFVAITGLGAKDIEAGIADSSLPRPRRVAGVRCWLASEIAAWLRSLPPENHAA